MKYNRSNRPKNGRKTYKDQQDQTQFLKVEVTAQTSDHVSPESKVITDRVLTHDEQQQFLLDPFNFGEKNEATRSIEQIDASNGNEEYDEDLGRQRSRVQIKLDEADMSLFADSPNPSAHETRPTTSKWAVANLKKVELEPPLIDVSS